MPAKPAPRFHVGQEVFVFEGYKMERRSNLTLEDAQRYTVIKVTRESAIIERHGKEMRFDIVTGVERRRATAIGSPDQMYNEETWVERLERQAILARLSTLGFENHYGRLRDYSTAALRKVAEILDADRDA
ncbi:hypothetical protein [Microbacterium sp. 77mftsu3.1]|uniref:beta barrel domain-containing protein n=1 Tax=Microbacterium sp. 77mftsu3.1 TaxID=1761802 RepID=UPI00037C4EF6|nr:hypothetical protein [Microbacterium sp. 77mftsu3.1]SDH33317.1 hypothetical protein SAMN04488590_3053 [Microbacterium sp. 77mftsu3.1]